MQSTHFPAVLVSSVSVRIDSGRIRFCNKTMPLFSETITRIFHRLKKRILVSKLRKFALFAATINTEFYKLCESSFFSNEVNVGVQTLA